MQIWDQRLHNIPPRLVQALIPYSCAVHLQASTKHSAVLSDGDGAVLDHLVSEYALHKVDFVDEGEYVRGRRVLCEGGDDSGVGEEIARIGAFKGARLNVEDVDEDSHIAKRLRLLRCEVGFCEGVLPVSFCVLASLQPSICRAEKRIRDCGTKFIPSTVPKIENKTPQELDSAMLDIDRCT